MEEGEPGRITVGPGTCREVKVVGVPLAGAASTTTNDVAEVPPRLI